ncbi:MAG: S1 RNA-binding domain-containing protein [Oscillospiraceae bacterium]|nr:S1 RNA-binding domain-containing protein [Oscillospiraceae bacterium]
MDLVVGAVVDGKVTGIMKFGAFVSLPGGKSGLVHISEIAYSYVNEVSDFLKEGQEVKVKIIGVDENGRINLSIKKAQEPPAQPPKRRTFNQNPNNNAGGGNSSPSGQPRTYAKPAQPAAEPSFEDKLKQFMADSDSKISGIKQYSDRKSSRRRGGR